MIYEFIGVVGCQTVHKMMQMTDLAAVFDACELFSSPACTINRHRMFVWKDASPRIEPAPLLRGRVDNLSDVRGRYPELRIFRIERFRL